MPEKCPECDSADLTWTVVKQGTGDVIDGRLGFHDVEVVFALGCDFCSETIRTVDGDVVAKVLTRTTREAI